MKSSCSQSEHQCEKSVEPESKAENIKIFNFTSIIELFQNCKVYFSEDIQKQYGPLKSKQKHSEIENYQTNQGLHKKDRQILDRIEELRKAQFSQFHFDDEEKQIVFEEGLLLCISMIEKFQNSHNYKKSRSIKRFLTKALLSLGRFLIEKISKIMNEDFDLVFCLTLDILLQNHSKATDKNQKSKNSKKEPWKLFLFQIPLILSNSKVPFSFYFIFNLLQQKFLFEEQFIKKSKASEEINGYVFSVCEKTLQTGSQEDSLSILIKTVCENFGCIQLPITYFFYCCLLSIIERQFSEKYEAMNSQSLQIFRIEREVFSIKNLIIMFETLIKHQNNSFKEIKIETHKTVFQSSFQQAQKFPCCLCSAVLQEGITLSFIQHKFKNQKIKNNSQCRMKITYCYDCYFDGETHRLQDLDRKNIELKNTNILTQIFLKSFWRQQFELEQIRKFRNINYNLLQIEGKIPKLLSQQQNNIPESDLQTVFNENQTAFICLRSLFSIESQPKKNKGAKIKNFISLKSSQQKILTLFLIMLNSKSQLLRLQVIQSISKVDLVEYFSQFLMQSDILENIQKDQENQENESNNNKNGQSNFLQNKTYQLFNQIKSRIYDKSETIQTQSIKFLFTLQQFYSENNLKIQIFQFVTSYYQDRITQNNLKNIPSSVIKIFEQEIQSTCKNISQQNKVPELITAKHMINIVLTLIFSFFNSKSQSFNDIGIEAQIHDMIMQVRRLIEKLLFLINEQEKQMKIVTNNLQYQNLVISFLKRFSFNKDTIKCFKVTDSILEKLIQLTQLGQGQQESDDFNDQQKNILLLSNLKLILQQLFQFDKQVRKSSVFSKSLQKKTSQKSKTSKIKTQNKNKKTETQNESFCFTFSSKDPTFNLNKVIKNILKREAKLTPLNCDILFLLIQKNILLNYESQTNFSETPSKVKRLILSLQTIRRFHDILKFVQNQIKQCNVDFISTYVKLYVSICIQINQEKKIEMLFNYYINVFRYFKKIWLTQYEAALQEHYKYSEEKTQPNTKNYNFFLRTIRTISIIATQFQKFKKIHNITQEYFSQIKNTKKNEPKYSIFTTQTQDAINSLQTEPQESFVKLYQQISGILHFLIDREILPDYMQLVNWSLDSLGMILSIHPHLFVKINRLFKQIPCKIEMKVSTINNYLRIFSSIITTGDSILMSLLSRSYENIKDRIWRQNQNSFEVYRNFQNFCQITFSLLKQDIISFLDVTPLIFYCLFIRNKKINGWAKDYLQYLNKKGNDGILFNNFQITMINVSNKLQDTDKYFFSNKEYFQNCQNLGKINKDRQWNQRFYLQKDLKQIKVRSTIVKKISQALLNSLELKNINNFSSFEHLLLMLKILENQKQMDVYQLEQVIDTLQKVIRENYIQIIGTKDGDFDHNGKKNSSQDQFQNTQEEFDKQFGSLHMKLQKRRMMFVVGQMMYTLIKLINEKKLKRFKNDLQKLIQAKKFNSVSINMRVNCPNQKQINSKKNLKQNQSSYVLNYQECLHFFKYLDYIINSYEDQIQKGLLEITKEFKILAQKMYRILFEDQKPRVLKSNEPSNETKKNKLKKSLNSNNDSDQEQSQYTESQYTERSASRQKSLSKIPYNSSNKKTKRINTRSNNQSRNDNSATKKIAHQTKNLTVSLPKKIVQRLSTINQEITHDEQHVRWGEKQSRRSKRIMQREISKKEKRTYELR